MSDAVDLDRYFARIGYAGTTRPDAATLAALHDAHTRAIPFEGLDPFLGRPVDLDLAALTAKLIDGRRGGYCFEQNALFRAVLEAIGFSVVGLAARVRWMSPPETPLGPRSHMLLKVDLPEGVVLADVGFGACLLDAPLRFETDVEQRTRLGTFRLRPADGRFALEARQPGGWRTAYVFDLEPQLPADYDLSNWFTSTNPQMPFLGTAVLERLAETRRHKLVGRRHVTEARDGEIVRDETIEDAEALARLLDEVFGITPPRPVADWFDRLA